MKLLAASDGTILDDPRNRVADVYFVQLGRRGLIKIGYSTDLNARVRALVSGHPSLRLIGSIPGTRLDEAAWHKQWQHLRSTGEWFRPHPTLVNAIGEAILAGGWFGSELVSKSRTIPERMRDARKKTRK